MTELNEDDIQLIFNHLNGSLTDAEHTLFEQRYQKDATFRAEVAAYEKAKLASFIGGQSKIKDILKDEAAKYKAEQEQAKNVKIMPLRTWILRGVAAATLIGIASLVFQYMQKQKLETLYISNFTPFENEVITHFRGNEGLKIDTAFQLRHDSATIELAKKAFDLYSSKQYLESLTIFNQIKTADDTLSLYKANAFLAATKTNEAMNILTDLSANGKGYTKAFSEWYLALAYLKQGNKATCISVVQKIMTYPHHPFFKEAKQLSIDL
jgi:hypothetical protein